MKGARAMGDLACCHRVATESLHTISFENLSVHPFRRIVALFFASRTAQGSLANRITRDRIDAGIPSEVISERKQEEAKSREKHSVVRGRLLLCIVCDSTAATTPIRRLYTGGSP